jgi:hypothetical protein
MLGDVGGQLRLFILDHTPVSSGSTLGEAFLAFHEAGRARRTGRL